jgi:cell division septal protein FtsQ
LAKKRKSRFRIRYLLILLVLYFLYRILIISLPIGKASVSYSGDITEKKKSEVGSIVKKVGIENLEELKNSIESLSWVELVVLERTILRELKISVVSRVPVVRVADAEGKVIDKKGVVFDFEKANSLPAVELSKGVSEKEIAQVIDIIEILDDFNINRIRINPQGVRTRCSNLNVEWGNDEFKRKYEILNLLLGDNMSDFKGKLDFRFKNMVVLRR